MPFGETFSRAHQALVGLMRPRQRGARIVGATVQEWGWVGFGLARTEQGELLRWVCFGVVRVGAVRGSWADKMVERLERMRQRVRLRVVKS